jgi:palmitoyl-protein thioesterase
MKLSLATALLIGTASTNDLKFPIGWPTVECPIADYFTQVMKSYWEPEEIVQADPLFKANPNGVPTAMFHGFGDACINPGMGNIDKIIAEGTGAHVECIEVGLPSLGEVINNIETVAQKSCDQIKANKNFQGEFNVIGLSQGGLLARYIVEECEMPGKVRNMVTIGGPHMGVDAVPHCISGVACELVNYVARKLVYLPIVQDWLVPAGYFRDAANFQAYLKGSVFLPALNNESEQKTGFSQARKDRFSALNGAQLIMFDQDTMIYPKETAHFQSLDSKGKNVLPLEETDFYKQDYIGLRSLKEAGKADFVTWSGDHLQFSIAQLNEQVIPFLMK